LNYTRRYHVFAILPLQADICKRFLLRKCHTVYYPVWHLHFSCFHFYAQRASKFEAILSAVSVNDITSKIVLP